MYITIVEMDVGVGKVFKQSLDFCFLLFNVECVILDLSMIRTCSPSYMGLFGEKERVFKVAEK